MPDITFLLPHWIYWIGLVGVPLAFMVAARRYRSSVVTGVSLPLAYFFWAIGGFVGIHRLYMRSRVAALFIALFVGVIFCNYEAKLSRNAHSIASNEVYNADYDLNRARDEGDADDVITALGADLEEKSAREEVLAKRLQGWRDAASYLALVILVLLIADAVIMPKRVRRAHAEAEEAHAHLLDEMHDSSGLISKPATGGDWFSRNVSKLNALAGEFAAYWTVIAVFVFYYEVIARYVFNSPTIWAHESMFLMFGMQYLIAGGFCLRENSHVRVDVLYMHLTPRGKAIADLVTSFFFFIFTVSLAVTGWIFFHDSFSIGQVSHTEWEIPHWPIKFALPLGGLLIVLQGLAHLLKDIQTLRGAVPT